jgi:hypothetical protein
MMSDVPDRAFGKVSSRAAILSGVNAVIANKFKSYPPMRTSPKDYAVPSLGARGAPYPLVLA